MNFKLTIAVLAALCLISTADASIFLHKMTNFLTTPTLPYFVDFMMWQVLAIVGPLLTGPIRVIAYIFWNLSYTGSTSTTSGGTTYTVTMDATGAIKAYWFLNSGVTSFDKFTQFIYDIIIYGVVYPMIPSSYLP